MPSLAESLGKELKTILIFVGIIWAVFLVSCLLPGLTDYGLQPRSVIGLLGIITMPFLHGSLGHLVANTIPLIVLLFLLSGSRAKSWPIVLEIMVLGGVLLWICGRDANHVGASALISGLITFLMLGGFFERRPVPIVVAIITLRAVRRLVAVGIHSARSRQCRGTVTCAARSPAVCWRFSWRDRPSRV